MPLYSLFIFYIWRFLVFVSIFVIIHYLRGLDIGITAQNYIYFALPFLIWAEFGIRTILKNEDKIIFFDKLRITPFVVTAVGIINFFFVDILAGCIWGIKLPWLINTAFAILFLHGKWGTFALAVSSVNID